MQQTTKISTNVLKVHPRNQEFFDDIDGIDYEQFRDSIARNGYVHTPLIVTPDMTVVSGHQRLKACIEVGIDKVDVIIRDDINSEDDKLKVLLETNFMRQKNNQAKQVKVASEYVGLVGNTHGGNRASGNCCHLTYDEIASALGVSTRTLRDLLEIDRKLIPQIREMFDNGSITKTTATKVWCKLSSEDQEKLFLEIGKDKIAKMTQAQTQKYLDEIKSLKIAKRDVEHEKQQLQQQLQREEARTQKVETRVVEKVVEKIIDKTDYNLKNKLDEYENRIQYLNNKISVLEEGEVINTELIDNCRRELKEYHEFRDRLLGMKSIKGGDSDEVDTLKEIDELYIKIDDMIRSDLSPVRYSRCMEFINRSRHISDSFINLLDTVQQWCDDMRKELNKNNNIINVEEF